MDILMKLWQNRIDNILHQVEVGEADHREIASMAAQVGADYHGRFVVELLQNASDAASEARIEESTVTIIRVADIVTVSNEGLPFTEKGLRSITSLGLSTKDPQDALGNKGIGFKSVFQVSEQPEVYSAGASGGSPLDDRGLMFRLSLSPFADAKIGVIARGMVEDWLQKRRGRVQPDEVERLFAEIEAAAPFKFPLPLSSADLEIRLAALPERPPGQTMVVLPHRTDVADLSRIVDAALDEVFVDKGAAILFLPSVSTIRVIDRVRGFERIVSRRANAKPSVVPGHGTVSMLTTEVREGGQTDARAWRMIARKVGTADVVSADVAADEAKRINELAQRLPGSNWDTVRSSPVCVAIPICSSQGTPLAANGRICIGLPTKDQTGTPAWVNAHFHGSISRTGIDLTDNPYNRLLFSEAVRLHGALVECLKTGRSLALRRTATLAFERGLGPLGDALFASGGHAWGDIVLSGDGKTFLRAEALCLLDAKDLDALRLMVPSHAEAASFGINLPEDGLARRAKVLLEALPGRSAAASSADVFLVSRGGRPSLVEHAAKANRRRGPRFWVPFLNWILGRYRPDQLRDLRILPVGRRELAISSQSVFLPPPRSLPKVQTEQQDAEVTELPGALATILRFFDGRAAPLRKPDSRNLTKLAAMLAPDAGGGLVRRPRFDELLQDAIAPLMRELGTDEHSRAKGAELLRQAVQWLCHLSDKGRERLGEDLLRVPVMAPDDAWAWVPPNTVYFGRGWMPDETGRLLQEAYGDNSAKLLVPWEPFAATLRLSNDDLDRWVGTLEFLGVRRSPRLVTPPETGYRPAPFISQYGGSLAINSWECPIAEAEPYWRKYLEACQHRRTQTSSRQPYHFRSPLWVDGLEKDHARSAVVQLMLLNPEVYEKHTTVSLERQDRPGCDSTLVRSLWAFAISKFGWRVIPTQRGPMCSLDAWLIDNQQRGSAGRRLERLNHVLGPYASSEKLLAGIGVTTLQAATVRRLLHALDGIGRSCASSDVDARRATLALSEDLFERLQSAYADQNHPPLEELGKICLPMRRGSEVVGVIGAEVTVAYLNDDPVRSRFVPGFEHALVWPLQTRRAHKDLIAEIRQRLGDTSVTLASEAAVDTGFIEDPSTGRTPLLDWLAANFPERPVACDLACLIAYAGRQEANPAGDEFATTWRTYQTVELAFGRFPDEAPASCFYDGAHGCLQVDAALSREEMVEATWALVGLASRDTWAAYAKALQKGSAGKFLAEHQVGTAQRENVEHIIGFSSADRFMDLRPAAFMLWRIGNADKPVDAFLHAWPDHARSVRSLCEWIGRQDLMETLAANLEVSEEAASLAVLRASGMVSRDLQAARRSLGLPPLRFSHKTKAWRTAADDLVSILKVCVVRTDSVSPRDVEAFLRDAALYEAPDDVACDSGEESDLAMALLRHATSLASSSAQLPHILFVKEKLEAIATQNPANMASASLPDVPQRDVRVYRDDNEMKRTRDAEGRFQDIASVATALAAVFGETVDVDALRSSPLVSLLLDGWWANCFSLTMAVQRVLQSRAPRTTQRMSEERVFRDPAPAREMALRFPELQSVGEPLGLAAPERIVTVFGASLGEEALRSDLLRGTGGKIGEKLGQFATGQVSLAALAMGERNAVAPSERGEGGRRTRRARDGNNGKPPRDDTELTGLIGEAFVYEWLRGQLPGFDERAWVSKNRSRYGLADVGEDDLGYDFCYRDVEGRLQGRMDRPTYYIEVKASAGDGESAFPMSANEWEQARECHGIQDQVYVVIRIADVRSGPRVSDVIYDPFGLYRKGQIALTASDMWVRVGKPSASMTSNRP